MASDSASFAASAIDELGFPITYDWDAFSGSTIYNSSNLPPQTTSITQTSAGAFQFVHDSASVTPAGTFNFRTKVSDGAATNVALKVQIIMRHFELDEALIEKLVALCRVIHKKNNSYKKYSFLRKK